MQLERSYFRRVKSVRPFIYENCLSSRRAYFSIRLAVKTSRPQSNLNFTNAKIDYYMTNVKAFNTLMKGCCEDFILVFPLYPALLDSLQKA